MKNIEALKDFYQDYCKKVDMTFEQLYSKSRKREIVDKRMILAYLLRTALGMTYHDIGEALKKNHATIIYHIRHFIYILHKIYVYSNKFLLEKFSLLKYRPKTRLYTN